MESSPDPICTIERIDQIFDLLEKCSLLIEQPIINYQPKPKVTVDEEGWSTIPVTSSLNDDNKQE